VIEPLSVAGKIAVIPPKSNRKARRSYDEPLYEARHLVENFFCWAKQFCAIATRYDKTARITWPRFTWSERSPGSIDDRP
ncbi:MAG: hypothetical protein NTW47_22930, partial [Proteobacteria bacterium]|nr:hypothetical protein [Pseudomonadota bacterium]